MTFSKHLSVSNEPVHEISNNAYAQSDQSLCSSLEYSMIVKILTEHHLEFLCLKGGCTGSSESTLVKMPNCRKSRAMAQMVWFQIVVTDSLSVLIWDQTVCKGYQQRTEVIASKKKS